LSRVRSFSTLAYGAFADRYGRRPVLLIGLFLFLLGSMISALAGSFMILLIGRLVQSIGAGCGITLARAIARDVYGAKRLIKAIAYLTMFFAIGGLLAPGVGGVLVDQFGWRSVSFAGITGLAITLGAYFSFRKPGRRTGPRWFDHVLRLSPFRQPSAPVIHTGCTTGVPDRRDRIVHTMKEPLQAATEFGLYFAMVPRSFIIGSHFQPHKQSRTVERMILIGASLGSCRARAIELVVVGLRDAAVPFRPASS
jgi:DHA1 family bicyclomycin/chloramphenicol resistance-like MFS transporter